MQRILIALIILLTAAPQVLAELSLPSVFGDHMVLQREVPVRVWGKAKKDERVTIELRLPLPQGVAEHYESTVSIQAKADRHGNWKLDLPKQEAGLGYQLTISGDKTKKPIVIKDIAFGEVWVASGQSNMWWPVDRSANDKQEIDNSGNDQIRMWTATQTVKDKPAFDVEGQWAVASPKKTGRFSAVGYYYARELQQQLGVPVGILHSSWGGTPVEAWTSRHQLKRIDWAKPILKRYDSAVKTYDRTLKDYNKALKRWEQTRNGPENTGFKKGYAKPDFNDKKWKSMKLPQTWERAGLDKDGVVWYRKAVELPKDWAGQKLKLSLGPIDDGDTTYVNGQKIGETSPHKNNAWQFKRVYDVPSKLVKAGKLTIAVRVIDTSGSGGVWGKDEELSLARADGEGQAVSLAGDWKYLFAHEINAGNRPSDRRPAKPFGPDHPHAPAGLFNGMISPITPYTIKGFIWYQGESNASRAEQYEKLFPGMIHDWRKQWGQRDLPFLFVQLANYRKANDKVVDTDWAHLRDAQLYTLRTVKNTGMAVAIDIGEANDIHPRNKQDVGKRLARWALADTYGKKDVVKSGPIYKPGSLKIKDGKAFIDFDTFGSEIRSKGVSEPKPDTPLYGFTIAGKDGKFHFAQAQSVTVEGKVVVWSDKVKEPVAVRYGWADNPEGINLVNVEGLPASPFRTDDFKGPTDGRR